MADRVLLYAMPCLKSARAGASLSFLCLIMVSSCGGDGSTSDGASMGGSGGGPETREEACAAVSGCRSPLMMYGGPKQAIWRVRIIRGSAGAARIEAVQELEVAAAIGAPQASLAGTHGLAALDAAGEPLDFQFVEVSRLVQRMRLVSSRSCAARQTSC